MNINEQNHTKIIDLVELITQHFDQSELNDLCFKLGIDHEMLEKGNKSERIRELVTFMHRRLLLSDLVAKCKELRSRVIWPDIPSETAIPGQDLGRELTNEADFPLTGFKDLDRILGGLHKGDLIAVSGRPGMGKNSIRKYNCIDNFPIFR